MLKDITLGQFFPGNSFLHRLDPRTKIIATMALMVIIFLARSLWAYLLLAAVVLVLVAVSTIPPRTVLKSLKPLIFIILFTGSLNLFLTRGEGYPLIEWWIFRIYGEGIYFAAMMASRIIMLIVVSTVVLTYTTSPIDLTDGIERLLAPGKLIRLPVHEFAMMMTIALRFIPTLIEETDKIMSAQKARGADFTTGSLKKRVQSLLPILIPLFISAFRRAEDLAVAMECRCYRGGAGRTKMKQLRMGMRDMVFFVTLVALTVGVVFVN
ncbi:MAG: energy-coupling factor transporter transmembrane protein EcfT [Oscillospiraceae bacterium]|nr:energy-coupling factor transporter transmembrane protein EcfT [Oscillospiraceae bacterium]